MDINMFAQTLFYLISSIAMIIVGTLLAVVLFHSIKVVKNMEIFSSKLNNASDEIGGKIKAILEKLSNMPILSFIAEKFLNRKKDTNRKGRTKEQ